MAVLPIRQFGDPILRAKSKRVSALNGSMQSLIDDMIETMQRANGAGLAAPQVGRLLRIIVIGIPGQEPFALVNPEIVKRSGERVVNEGCLSFPGHRADIKRAVTVICKGLDRHGRPVRIRASNDLLAQALEHEIDHLNGVLYIDYLESEDQLQSVAASEEP